MLISMTKTLGLIYRKKKKSQGQLSLVFRQEAVTISTVKTRLCYLVPLKMLWRDAADHDNEESLCWEQRCREDPFRPLLAALLEGGEQGRF